MIRSILWFRQDLRLRDNEALTEALRNSDELLPVYVFDPLHFRALTSFGTSKTGYARTRFLIETITDLRLQLQSLGSDLMVRIGDPAEILYNLSIHHRAYYVFCNRERTKEEAEVQDRLEKKLWTIGREVRFSRGKMLYYTSDLPFPVTHCPDSFTVFKKEVEQFVPVRFPLDIPESMPPLSEELDTGVIPFIEELFPITTGSQFNHFKGGEQAGITALNEENEINTDSLMATEGYQLSPWIAMGCLSPKSVYYHYLNSGKSADEIIQNLIYRDYLRLMGKKYGDRIFFRSGIKGFGLKNKTDPEALSKWQKGKTGVQIVDAAMNQLNQTGWIPDMLRRLVAGYFIKVLNLDWRLGAAYFESKLIDYDPCTNWVSWLNMAGLGPDSREDRIINYEAVGKRMDPEGLYINTWMN